MKITYNLFLQIVMLLLGLTYFVLSVVRNNVECMIMSQVWLVGSLLMSRFERNTNV